MKCIGFDSTEDHRTFATSGGVKLCPADGVPTYADRYEMKYFLREWGLDRAACGKIITAAGLALPPKSACFFCPSMKLAEIEDLDDTDLNLALEMERLYRAGRHFRGDDAYSVKAVHTLTNEKVSIDVFAKTPAAAREVFRASHNDTARPYKYKVKVSHAVVGLSRNEAWKDRIALPVLSA